jgi:hypothetical protein
MLARVEALGEFPARQETIDRLRRVLNEGWRFKVDTATGILLQIAAAEAGIEFSNFKWITDNAPSIDGEWLDRATPLNGLGSRETVMALFRISAAAKSKDIDGYVLDMASGDYRRIPANTGASSPGCFLPRRTKALAHIFDVTSGAAYPYLIDLKTGDNSPFGSPEMHQSMSITFGGSLSPDGKSVALVFLPDIGNMEDKRICAVDIESNASRTIAAGDDFTDALWLNDGNDMVIEKIVTDRTGDPNALIRHEVGVLQKNGKYRRLGLGKSPVVLKQDQIVYYNAAESRWVVIGKDGRGKKRLHSDINDDFGALTANEDRTALIMIKFGEFPTTTPYRFDLKSEKLSELKWPNGAWAGPVWAR